MKKEARKEAATGSSTKSAIAAEKEEWSDEFPLAEGNQS